MSPNVSGDLLSLQPPRPFPDFTHCDEYYGNSLVKESCYTAANKLSAYQSPWPYLISSSPPPHRGGDLALPVSMKVGQFTFL